MKRWIVTREHTETREDTTKYRAVVEADSEAEAERKAQCLDAEDWGDPVDSDFDGNDMDEYDVEGEAPDDAEMERQREREIEAANVLSGRQPVLFG